MVIIINASLLLIDIMPPGIQLPAAIAIDSLSLFTPPLLLFTPRIIIATPPLFSRHCHFHFHALLRFSPSPSPPPAAIIIIDAFYAITPFIDFHAFIYRRRHFHLHAIWHDITTMLFIIDDIIFEKRMRCHAMLRWCHELMSWWSWYDAMMMMEWCCYGCQRTILE